MVTLNDEMPKVRAQTEPRLQPQQRGRHSHAKDRATLADRATIRIFVDCKPGGLGGCPNSLLLKKVESNLPAYIACLSVFACLPVCVSFVCCAAERHRDCAAAPLPPRAYTTL
eukprot:COSAG06_NODE_4648_length_4068_cov_2.547493_5_plen_113_part_00